MIFLLLISLPVFADVNERQERLLERVDKLERLNRQLVAQEDEESIGELLERQVGLLDDLMMRLHRTSVVRLPSALSVKRQNFLQSRMTINQERGNKVAVLRDRAELAAANTRQAIRDYLEFLIQASNNYAGIEEIVEASQRALERSQRLAESLPAPEGDQEGQIFVAYKQNYRQFTLVNATFQDILNYVINNPRQIASTHWFQEFSLLSLISYINDFDVLRPVNHKLVPFKIDIGGLSVSIAIMMLVYFSYPVLFRFTSRFITKHVIAEGEDTQAQIYYEIRKPARALLIFFGIDLATYAFFYKTDYRPSIEDITFVIYSLIIVWLMFKILDTVVLMQVQKISQANIELRKELINLAVQTAKVLILIVVLAFGLNHFGISITAIMSTLGIGGLAFALAAKDTLSNLFGGITILFDNVFRMGDWVKIGDVEGTVAEIGLRSTTIRTFDNALITIPNAQVSVSSVMNWNRRLVGRRIKMYVGVTYESNMDDIRKALAELREMLRNHPGIANPKQKHASGHRHFRLSSLEDVKGIKATQLVFMDRYNDSSIDLLIYCFSKTVDWAEWLKVKEDVMFKIAEILKKNHLEFAYPTQVRIHRGEMKSPV